MVHPQEELRQVKNNADQLQAFHGKAIGYDSYCNFSCLKYAPKGGAGTAKRNVYAHDLADYEDGEFHEAYNLDSDIVDLQANVHKQNTKDPIFARNRTFQKSCSSTFSTNRSFPKACLSSQQWHSLQPEAHALGICCQMKPRPSFWVCARILGSKW